MCLIFKLIRRKIIIKLEKKKIPDDFSGAENKHNREAAVRVLPHLRGG